MDILDLIVVVAALVAALAGYQMGFLARIVSWIGLAGGFYVAARFLPQAISASRLSNPPARLVLAVVVLLAGVSVGYTVGLAVGARLHHALPLGPLREADRGIGAGAGALSVFVALWLLVPTLASVAGWPARVTQQSAISRWVSSHFPVPPNMFQTLRREVSLQDFPQVFQSLSPGGNAVRPPAGSPLSAATTTAVAASTVRVQGEACNRIQDGSGFTVAPDLVATNAHVVAGEAAGSTNVFTTAGRELPATVVAFDPNRDLALLAVPHLGEPTLAVGTGRVLEKVAAFGHPGGQVSLAVTPARILREISAVGSNLYGTATTTRDVYVLSAVLHPGDSGSPVVTSSGAVVGVVFAIAEGQANTGYALTSRELKAAMAEPHGHGVSTRSCLTS